MAVSIAACMCAGLPFTEIVPLARSRGWDMRTLAREKGCGTHCGWCIAYLRRGLRTGETEFKVLLPKESL